jgi:putative flippase GtrA
VDSNAATTGNPASFGTFNGATLQISAANVRVGSNLACTFTNAPAPTLTVTQKTIVISPATFNPPETFGYAGNNGWTFQQNSSTALNTVTKGVTQTLSAVNVATTLMLVVPTLETGWRIASIKCTDTKSAASGNPATTLASSTTSTVTIPANYVVANAAIQCAVIATRQQL